MLGDGHGDDGGKRHLACLAAFRQGNDGVATEELHLLADKNTVTWHPTVPRRGQVVLRDHRLRRRHGSALFADPEFDGPPERVELEEIDETGNVVDDTVVEEPEPIFDIGSGTDGTGGEGSIDPGDLDVEPTVKFYIDDTQVWVTAEATYHLAPDTQRLRLVEHRDFVTETVRFLFPDAGELRARWVNRLGRREVLAALEEHGIDSNDLVSRTGLVEADPVDALVHLAWNQPLATRTDRVRRVRKEHAAFFETYQPAAREVLGVLLDKYAEHGISQLDDPGVLQVPPLPSVGSPVDIAERFGSNAALNVAVERLAELLYVA